MGRLTLLAAAAMVTLAGCGNPGTTGTPPSIPEDVFAGLSKQTKVYSVFTVDEKTRMEVLSRDAGGNWYVIEGSEPHVRWLFVDGKLYWADKAGWAVVERNSCPEAWGSDKALAGRGEPDLLQLARSFGERAVEDLGEAEIEPLYNGLGRVAVGPEGNVRGRRYLLEDGAELRTDGETRWALRKRSKDGLSWSSVHIAILDTMPLIAPPVTWKVTCSGERSRIDPAS